jgi:hypothetical protein
MRDCESMRIVCTESFSGWHIFDGLDERLVVWLPPSKAIKPDLVIGQIDFSSNETTSPKRIKEIGSPLDFDLTKVVCTAQIDDSSFERTLVIWFPVFGEWTSGGTRLNAWRRALSCCESKAIGASLDGIVVLVDEALPDLLLPAAVEAFDDGLESILMRWREDGDGLELQTEADDTTKGVRKLTCTAKNSVVVELGILREPMSAPMGNQRFGGDLGGPRRSNPTGTQACVKTDGGQDVDVSAATQSQVFNEVEAIDVGPPVSDAREVPAFRRRGSTNSSPSIENTAPQEDSTNGADGGNLLESAVFENQLDHDGTVVTEVALVTELFTNSQDQILHAKRRGDLLASSTSWPIEPGHAVNTVIGGAPHPTLNGPQSYAKLPRHPPLRASPPHSVHDLLTTRFNLVFCSRKAPRRKDIYNQCDSL